MYCLNRKINKIPLSSLPFGFRERLTTLAPIKIVKELSKFCLEVEERHSKVYNQVFITDNNAVYEWASKDTFLFEMFKLIRYFKFFAYLLDGFNINPTWQAALKIDEIVEKQQYIYVADTLVLYCDSAESYEEVIPFICGSYPRLVLHGNIHMDQVVRLTHSDIKKVRINATIEIPQQRYFYFSEFITDHVYDFNSYFVFCPESVTNQFQEALFRSSFRHSCRYFVQENNNVLVHTFAHFVTYVVAMLFTTLLSFVFLLLVCYYVEPHSQILALFTLLLVFLSFFNCAMLLNDDHPKMDTFDASVPDSTDANNGLCAFIHSKWCL